MATFAQRYSSRYVPGFRPAPVKPDHSKQLDLFGNLATDSTNEPDAPLVSDSSPLADILPVDGAGITASEPATASAPSGARSDRGPAARTDNAPQDELSGRMGDGDAGMGVPADRGPPVIDFEPDPALTPSRDFR